MTRLTERAAPCVSPRKVKGLHIVAFHCVEVGKVIHAGAVTGPATAKAIISFGILVGVKHGRRKGGLFVVVFFATDMRELVIRVLRVEIGVWVLLVVGFTLGYNLTPK